MPNLDDRKHRGELQRIAKRAMTERGLEPDFPPAAVTELARIESNRGQHPPVPGERDLRGLLWCSIDNDDSRDLDQLSVAVPRDDGLTRVLVAIADVDSLVPKGGAIDLHASTNTTSVYTPGGVFPMLPEPLSTDLTSLGHHVDRSAIVVDMAFQPDGALQSSEVYAARVRNQAKLAYPSIAAWIDGKGPLPDAAAQVPGLSENILLQHRVAERLRARRHKRGALSLQTIEARAVFEGDRLHDLVAEESNVAKSLIEELMVASNGVTARYLASRSFPSIRRVVREPQKWDRIVEIAAERRAVLPRNPDGPALEAFLISERERDPAYFPDLSLCVIKLLGRGEYVLELPGEHAQGHFGLAVSDYAHSTAPNRRYPDLLIQRLLKAALQGRPVPYGIDELASLATHCSEQEEAAKKVERQVVKSAAAMLLHDKIGCTYAATVTGASDKGTFVRLASPAVEGKLVGGFEHRKVGDRLHVRLVHTDIERGYVDFDAQR